MKQAMSDLLGGCQETFGALLVLRGIIDGVRMGKPAKEYIVTCVVDLQSGKAATLTPLDFGQVLKGGLTFQEVVLGLLSIFECSLGFILMASSSGASLLQLEVFVKDVYRFCVPQKFSK